MTLSPGARIGAYEVLASLGAGGMGEVYQARDSRLNRMVALKVLRPEFGADPERRQRFVQEAQIASNLQQPHIVTIYDIGSSGGIEYIAMELVRGSTLEATIPRKGLRLNETLRIAIQVADALEAAHAAGIVHRDLKPGNIMIGESGIVKVLDFGLAKLAEAPPTELEETRTERAQVHTEKGTILGSVPYMSPEQAEGKSVDARSDIFSFGAILYEMLSGHRAFAGESKMSTLAAVIRGEPAPLASVVEGIPRDMERLITRCLRKDVAKRAQHMADVRLALEELKEESESGSLMAPPVAPEKRRRRIWWIAAAALFVAAAALWWRPQSQPERAFEPLPLTTYPGSENFPSFSPDGNQIAFAWQKNRRDPWDIYLKMIGGGGPPLQLTSDGGTHTAAAWSPDGKWIAYFGEHVGGRSGVFLVPALGGPERLLAEGVRASALDWSPDGKWLAASPRAADTGRELEAGIVLVSAETGEGIDLAKQNAALRGSRDGRFSPDGKHFAYLRGRDWTSQVYVATFGSKFEIEGKPLQVTFSAVGALHSAWTADGREIVFMSGSERSSGSLARVVPDGRGRLRQIPGLGYTAGAIAIARKGGRMAFATGGIDSDIWRYDLKGEEPPSRWASSTLYENNPAYSPDGKRIAMSSSRAGSREIWVCDADGNNAQQFTHFGGPTTGSPRWSPDGRLIAFDSRPEGNPELFVVGAEGSGLRRLTNEPGEDARPAWSPDGKWIYFSSERSGRLEIWRMPAQGGPALQVTKDGGISVTAGPDGEWLFYVRSDQDNGLRRIRPDGSGDSLAVDASVPFLGFTVSQRGLWFVNRRAGITVEMMSFAGGSRSQVLVLQNGYDNGISVSPDERYLLLVRPDEKGTDLMLVEGFR